MFDEHHLSLYIAVLEVFDIKAEFRKNAVVDDFAAAGRESERRIINGENTFGRTRVVIAADADRDVVDIDRDVSERRARRPDSVDVCRPDLLPENRTILK